MVEREIPRVVHTPAHMEDVNCVPRSEVRMARIPKCAIQVEIKARTQDSAEMDCNGATSGHQDILSIIVRRYVNL